MSVKVRLAETLKDHAVLQRMLLAFTIHENTTVDPISLVDRIFVAEIEDTIVGVIAAHKLDALRWQLTFCYVTGGHRRTGIGSALVRAIVDSIGPGVELHVRSTISAQPFFQKLGFQAVDRTTWNYVTSAKVAA